MMMRIDKPIKIFSIPVGGINRTGIALSQFSVMSNFNAACVDITMCAGQKNNEKLIDDFKGIGVDILYLPDRQKHPIKYFFALKKTLKKGKYDIVHVHGSSSLLCLDLLAAKFAKVPVRIAHSHNTTCNNKRLNNMLYPLFKCSYTDAFACGEDAGKWLFRDKPFTVIHNGQDFSDFHFDEKLRSKKRDEYNLSGKVVIGNVGNFNTQKNHKFLIEVFAELHKKSPDTVLYLMGYGGLRNEVEQLVADKGLKDCVIFAGGVNDVAERLQAMDLMILPSLYEGLPTVVTEWQAEGLPCLISDVITRECAPTDLVEFKAMSDGYSSWADKVLEMLHKKRDRKSDSQNAIAALKENGFDIKESAEKVAAHYKKLVEVRKK